MKIFWEGQNWAGSVIEPAITCLSWMPVKDALNGSGNTSSTSSTSTGSGSGALVSTGIAASCGGLLAAGSESGVVGITQTDVTGGQMSSRRYNFNLRGHHSPIVHVSWNQMHSKLVSCDTTGFIYVWMPNDERWSVELVNDRGVKVRDFCWSPNGSATLICYDDNFVLIGTATGQRVWSNTYDTNVNCGAWSPNSEEIVIGFDTGSIQVLNHSGSIVHERRIFETSISRVSFSSVRKDDGQWTLAICSVTDEVVFTNMYFEIEPAYTYQSVDPIHQMEWSRDGTMLALICPSNRITILSPKGRVLHVMTAPLSRTPLTAFTWAHDDSAVIVAAGGSLVVGRIIRDVPLLTQLVSYQIWINLGRSLNRLEALTLPVREKANLRLFDHHIIRCRVPRTDELMSAICMPTDWRWYCTIVPVPRKSYQYLLCVEHMGGLVPILLGRQVNRIIPQFVISLPAHFYRQDHPRRRRFEHGSTAQVEDAGAFRRDNRSNPNSVSLWRQSKRRFRRFMNKRVVSRGRKSLPTLVLVSSNVWCTKFKITTPGIDTLPDCLAHVVYKTSVLHLQPRQMTIHLADLREPVQLTDSPRPAVEESSPFTLSPKSANYESEEVRRLLSDDFDGIEFDGDHETELLAEERVFFTNIMAEFENLRTALLQHIERMNQCAADLEVASSQMVVKKVATACSKQSQLPSAPTNTPVLDHHSPFPSTSAGLPLPNEDFWKNKLQNIEFIDDNENSNNDSADDTTQLLSGGASSSTAPSPTKAKVDRRPPAPAPAQAPAAVATSGEEGTMTATKKQKQIRDIRRAVEKLSLMADELSSKRPHESVQQPHAGGNGRNASANLRVGNNTVGSKAAPVPFMEESPAILTVGQLRAEVRRVAQLVTQVEGRISNEVLHDIRGDLLQRIQHIKSVLGDATFDEVAANSPVKKGRKAGKRKGKKEKPARRLLTMTNKTPFWNEQTQVYQLDFGGRVTQESAKNFQIEYNSEQVMQFGRIENGAYTLDFCSPFSVVQAFSIALASITQRLK